MATDGVILLVLTLQGRAVPYSGSLLVWFCVAPSLAFLTGLVLSWPRPRPFSSDISDWTPVLYAMLIAALETGALLVGRQLLDPSKANAYDDNRVLLSHGAAVFVMAGTLLAWHGCNTWAIAVISLLHETIVIHRDELEAAKTAHRAAQMGEKDAAWRRVEKAKKFLGNLPCGFCGHKSAPVICSKCKSIQWSDLYEAGPNDERGLPRTKWHFPRAAFIVENRFQILTSLLSVAVFGLASVMLQVSREREQQVELKTTKIRDQDELTKERERESHEQRAIRMRANEGAFASSMARLRSTLITFASDCLPRTLTADGKDTSSISECSAEYAEVLQRYYEMTWTGPSLVADIASEAGALCGSPLDGSARAQGCIVLELHDVFNDSDVEVHQFINAYGQYLMSSRRDRARLEAATIEFARVTRKVGCTIAAVAEPHANEFDPALLKCEYSTTDPLDAGEVELEWDAWFEPDAGQRPSRTALTSRPPAPPAP
jgi:hypothetical protein